jgi:hypothetical protein
MKAKHVFSIAIMFALYAGIALFAFSCKEKEECIPFERPKDLKPIDWENYNDVYTVFWNYYQRECSEMWVWDDSTKTIKVSGWIVQDNWAQGTVVPGRITLFTLVNNSKDIYTISGYPQPYIAISVKDSDVAPLLFDKFTKTDITKKCYIRGSLFFKEREVSNYCLDYSGCFLFLEIVLDSIDDIYFE